MEAEHSYLNARAETCACAGLKAAAMGQVLWDSLHVNVPSDLLLLQGSRQKYAQPGMREQRRTTDDDGAAESSGPSWVSLCKRAVSTCDFVQRSGYQALATRLLPFKRAHLSRAGGCSNNEALEHPAMSRPKRRCVRNHGGEDAKLPSAAHYVGYVEEDETEDMIMRKFAELDKLQNSRGAMQQQGDGAPPNTGLCTTSMSAPALTKCRSRMQVQQHQTERERAAVP